MEKICFCALSNRLSSNSGSRSIDDLQMLLGRDGQLYIIDPLNINSPSSKYLSDFSQNERENSIENLQEWRDTALNTLKEFNHISA
jgi:hypothetical protein